MNAPARQPDQPHDAPRRVISGHGIMADLTRGYDWGRHPLGPVHAWSDVLLTSVNTMLSNPSPVQLFWGPELYQFYNDAAIPLLAERHPGVMGRTARDIWQEAWEALCPQFEAVLLRGETVYEKNILLPVIRDGRLQDIYWTYTFGPVYEPSGAVVGIVDTFEDSSAARERDLIEERLTHLLEDTNDAIMTIDHDWIITYMNPMARRISLPVENVVGRNFWSSYPAVDFEGSPWIANYHRSMTDRVPCSFEAYYPEPINVWVAIHVQPSKEGITLFFTDITQQKRSVAALIQAEKLAAVGRLASSIAHEINNPLESVTNLLYLSQTTAGIPAEVSRYLTMAEGELRRVSVISSQTLSFHQHSVNQALSNLEEMLKAVLALQRGRIANSRVRVETGFRAVHPIPSFEGEMRQVFNHLVSNAVDAMSLRGGRLLVRLRASTDWTTGRPGVRITLGDTADGIPANVRREIFEPFFSTKGMAGTGLGLWVSQQIVERHGGTLKLRSQVGSGSVFTIFLPLESHTEARAA